MDIKITNSQIMELSWKLESIYLKLGSKRVLKLQKCNTSCDINLEMWRFVATLPLGSWPKQGLVTKARACEGLGQVWRPWFTFLAPGSVGECEEWSEFLIWELESWWISKSLENNCRGQNPLDWFFFYIIGKLLERKYLKWARMTHLDTLNTSYGQKKGRESIDNLTLDH
jgi:hypothetical protein